MIALCAWIGGEMVLLTPEGSTIGQQLLWLFGLDLFEGRSVARRLDRDDAIELGFAARSILADLGIETEEPEPDAFDLLIERFGRAFPGTVPLSVFARATLSDVDPLDDPDGALVAWMEHEEALSPQSTKLVPPKWQTETVGRNWLYLLSILCLCHKPPTPNRGNHAVISRNSLIG